jgi:DDE superfamily endonuclease
MEPSDALRALRTFRYSLYECLHRRADAHFELTDALLTADAVPSPVHLSLQAPHRRGWGSLYAALDRGRIDAEALRGLLARDPLAGGADKHPVYAVDVSVWPRCDAEASPERVLYYHPARHSAGQPIVAGWAYQFIARLNFVRESWTAPVEVERVRPAQDVNEMAAEQVKAFLRRSPEEGAVPLFVFDAGYDPVKVQQELEGSPCQILVRLRAGRRFYADPSLAGPPASTGRPRRHGPKMKCADPSTWPDPSTEYACEDAGYGRVHVRAWANLHPRRSGRTKDGAAVGLCPSCAGRWCWWRPSGYLAARGGASRRHWVPLKAPSVHGHPFNEPGEHRAVFCVEVEHFGVYPERGCDPTVVLFGPPIYIVGGILPG